MIAAPSLSRPWTGLTSAEKEAAVEPLWLEGKSAGQIADYLGATSRHSIITVVSRLRERCGVKPMDRTDAAILGWTGRRSKAVAPAAPAKPKQKLHAGNIARKKASRAFDPGLPAPPPPPVRATQAPLECRGVPLIDLRKGECRWAGNEAEPGDLHLFCGLPATNRSYCAHHAAIAYVQPDRRAHRSLEKVVA